MTREELKSYYILQDRLRIHQPMFTPDYLRIREKLKSSFTPHDAIIRYECYNDVEAEMIRERLTPEERERVQFTWLFTIPAELPVPHQPGQSEQEPRRHLLAGPSSSS